MQDLKTKIHHQGLIKLDERIGQLKQELNLLQKSSEQETKSSMGDKYETGRSMIQLEIDKILRQLHDATKMKDHWKGLPLHHTSSVGWGSLVKTDRMIFFISVSLGQIQLDDQKVIALSPAAPLAKIMKGLVRGDYFDFLNTRYQILDLF
ncbi:MAG: hypothetical protein ACNS62_22130 [Candidatus Cyclobacteriaceae bacterium M3_2C_046]